MPMNYDTRFLIAKLQAQAGVAATYAGTALIPALAFILSDIVLATESFVLRDDHPARRWTPYAVWPLYWGAQAGFWAAFAAP